MEGDLFGTDGYLSRNVSLISGFFDLRLDEGKFKGTSQRSFTIEADRAIADKIPRDDILGIEL